MIFCQRRARKSEGRHSVKKNNGQIRKRRQKKWVAFGPARLLCSKSVDSPPTCDWKEELTGHSYVAFTQFSSNSTQQTHHFYTKYQKQK